MPQKILPRFDVLVCDGKMCTSREADRVSDAIRSECSSFSRVRIRRGGCFGLCDLGPNVVVRRIPPSADWPSEELDRQRRQGPPDEFTYIAVAPSECEAVLASHLDDDAPFEPALLHSRVDSIPPRSPIDEKMRKLRAKNQSGGYAASRESGQSNEPT